MSSKEKRTKLTVPNMLKLRRLPKRHMIPIQPPHPLMQIRIPAPNISDVALEMLDVDGVEAHNGGVEADVCFGGVRGREQVGG